MVDGSVVVWDLADEGSVRQVATFVPSPQLGWLAVEEQGDRIYNITERSVQVWSASTGELLTSWDIDLGARSFSRGAISRDGSRLAAVSEFGRIEVWDTADGRAVMTATLPGRPESRETLLSSDGSFLVVASSDALVRVYEVSSGELRHELVHSGDLFGVALSEDDRLLASGSSDGTIRVWSLQDPSQPLTLTGHSGAVNLVTFDPAGTRLFSAGSDGTVRVFAIDDEDLVTLAAARLGD
jgi:WD40 repeat protein